MSEMVERVAKAAYESLFLGSWPDDVGTSIDADGFRRAARAAIAAMREPTQAMWDAAEEHNIGGGITDHGASEPDVYDLEEVWPAMIDAALK